MSAILFSVQRLENYEVYDCRGDKLGVIDDLMLDVDGARVRYAVLLAKSALGLSRKRFAVPLGALALDTENECFMLDIDRSALAGSPGFDETAPPEGPDPLFASARKPLMARHEAAAGEKPT
jgi:sporulation protein YlmC with PRC-barrel domain